MHGLCSRISLFLKTAGNELEEGKEKLAMPLCHVTHLALLNFTRKRRSEGSSFSIRLASAYAQIHPHAGSCGSQAALGRGQITSLMDLLGCFVFDFRLKGFAKCSRSVLFFKIMACQTCYQMTTNINSKPVATSTQSILKYKISMCVCHI